jgi:hypothetical protein
MSNPPSASPPAVSGAAAVAPAAPAVTAALVTPAAAVAPPTPKMLALSALAALKAAGQEVIEIPGIQPESNLDIIGLSSNGDIFKVESSLDRRQWAKAPARTLVWTSVSFPPDRAARRGLPNDAGVYVFVAEPNIFSLPQAGTLLYVGKAKKIKSRIRAYIAELKIRFAKSSRPHIWRMTNLWDGHLKYYYTTTATVADAEALEDEMLDALKPYFNKELPAELSQRVRAFP